MDYLLWIYGAIGAVVTFAGFLGCLFERRKWSDMTLAVISGALWPLAILYLIGWMLDGDDHTAGT